MSFIFYIVVMLAAAAAILGLLSMLPLIPQEAVDALSEIVGWARSPTNLWPVDTTFQIVGLVILIEGVMLGVKIVTRLWSRLTASPDPQDNGA